jgi:signal transduction histidine kinase
MIAEMGDGTDPSAWSTSWSAEQLAEFVASVSSADSEESAAWAAVERTAEALDAEVAAIVRDGEVVAQVGYREGGAPAAELGAITPGATGVRLDVPGVGSCVAVAAVLDHPRGARLVVARPGPAGLTPQESGLLRGMARVAAMTMRMHRALDDERSTRGELERLAREQAALRRVATLVAKSASPDETFSAVAEELAQLSGAEIAIVLRYEADRTATLVGGWVATEGQITMGMRLTVLGEGVAVSIRQTGRPARTNRFAGPPGSVAHLLSEVGARTGSGSPIVVEDRLWGAVIAAKTRPEGLRDEAERRIPAFAELLATAIANAQARVEVRALADEQTALRRVATLVARAAPPAEVFAAVAAEVGQIMEAADYAMVARYDSDRAVEVVGGWSRTGDPSLVGRRTELGGRNVSSLVLARNEPSRVDHLAEETSATTAAARELGMRSSAGAPINVAGGLWGVVIVASTQTDALPAGIEHRLADFTDLVATAIANAQARQDVSALADEQAALRRVATLVARGEPPRTLFAAVAEEVGRLLPVDLAIITRSDSDGVITGVIGWSRTGDVTHLLRPAGQGNPNVSAMVVETGRPARKDDYTDSANAAALGIRSAVGAPISVRGRIWGAMIVASVRDEPLPEGIEDRLADFTELVATAIANAEAQGELTASRARIVATADETRRRIERDLHDGAQQRLVSVALQLRSAQAAVPPSMRELNGELDEAIGGLSEAIEELREIARGIHPAALMEGGLEPALRTLARRSSVPVQLEMGTRGRRLSERVEVTAYYVVSEALTNVSKHAKGTGADVDVDVVAGRLRISIDDDGVGGADPRRGSGLVGLRDRVEAIGGTMSVQSRAGGEGTHLLVELPVDPA